MFLDFLRGRSRCHANNLHACQGSATFSRERVRVLSTHCVPEHLRGSCPIVHRYSPRPQKLSVLKNRRAKRKIDLRLLATYGHNATCQCASRGIASCWLVGRCRPVCKLARRRALASGDAVQKCDSDWQLAQPVMAEGFCSGGG